MKTQPSDSDRLQQRNRELSILNAFAKELNAQVDLNRALQTALAQVADLLDLQTGWVWLLHQESGEPYLAASQNLPPALAENPWRMAGDCYCLDTFRAGDLSGAANVNVVTCSRLKNLVDGANGLRYHASIPLYAHSRQLGVLNVASTDWRELSPDDLRLLYTVGDLLSIAVERARLFQQSADLGALEERNRLARELHDTLAQSLAAIALQLESADALLETGAPSDRISAAVQRAMELTRASLEEARRSVLDLRAAPLEGRSLPEALATLVEAVDRQNGLRASLELIGAARPLPPRVEIGLYRIAQEALNNVARHAGARICRVRLTTTPGEVRLLVADDGAGFDTNEVSDGRLGLVGLNERARLLHGQLRLETSPGAGTAVEVVVPLLS
ncbi:MAG: GAF domain-containing sensor histidine kinase [Anaerolineae bacterium]|nr:GAF domain-containing sensor histidine kinase [Anaerolineae bacterium]